MDKFNFRYVKANAIIVIVAILASSLFAANKYINSHWGISFSVFAVLGFVFGIINTHLWNKRPCSWMYSVPDFSGKYEGTLKYEFRNEKCELVTGTLDHIKTVKQNGSCIVVRSQTRKPDGSLSSESLSIEASIVKETDGTFSLVYNYLNDGDHEQGFSPHYGTEVLKLINDGTRKSLIGRYYTDRLPYQTKGKIELNHINNN